MNAADLLTKILTEGDYVWLTPEGWTEKSRRSHLTIDSTYELTEEEFDLARTLLEGHDSPEQKA